MTRAALLRRVGGINDWQSERAELSPMSQRGCVRQIQDELSGAVPMGPTPIFASRHLRWPQKSL
jgi:hypothetical protein